MIGKLRGVVDSFGEDWVIIDVQGVGYQVSCSAKTLAGLPRPGEPATLAIETYVREDMIRLFGFTTATEREWFRLLQSVQGVGTRVALALLSTLSPTELANAVAMQDKASIARAPGIGPKVAQRIVSELKDKGPALVLADPGLARLQAAAEANIAGGAAASEAVSALVNLGYAQVQAGQAVASAMAKLGDEARTEQLIRAALRELAT
ncbi:Holliday junction branch migration protein RuvA [Rhodoligotrophos defluvii]|uniref:Holliday junction branch migration protein RuvA n=1 Tax=Rhodoligotrophos defluvii TaxID=2561934 RepID=UPI0010CA1DFC|nr:Holliday junction branch migration protein RuvA [Rhodoligotrophos defluvii]